jgi:uncharacterized protein involved in exopolysaccharide biosynthesis
METTVGNSKPLLQKRFVKTLLIGAVITGVIAYVATSPIFIKPLYRSEALIYVPLTIPSKHIEQQGIGFASDIEIDGHIQILQSGRLHDSLISRFNLAEEFGINMNEIGGMSKLYEKIDSRIKFEKTRYSSVSVSAMATDPVKAAEIANAIVELGDVIKEEILYASRRKVFMQAKTYFENKSNNVRELENRIDSLERNSAGRKAGWMVDNQLFKLKNQYAIELQELASRKNHLESVERDFNTELPRSYVISKAIPVSKPAWPFRKLIALGAVAAYIFLLLVFEIVRQDVKSPR